MADEAAATRADRMTSSDTNANLRCPICDKPAARTYRPFCSKRCADIDLGRWLSGSYAIASTEDSDEDGERPFDADHDEGAPQQR